MTNDTAEIGRLRIETIYARLVVVKNTITDKQYALKQLRLAMEEIKIMFGEKPNEQF
jgi:hypothetical protein